MPESLCELTIDYTFSAAEHDLLHDRLGRVAVGPYRHYEPFRRYVHALVANNLVPSGLIDFCRELRDSDPVERPVVMLRNVPIDHDIPPFEPEDPLRSKYDVKKTFVAEAFLQLFSYLTGTQPVGRTDISNGDVFYDIYPKRDRWETAGSRGLLAQPFHKDLGNQPVVPEHLYMVGMRNSERNRIYTTFVRNADIVRSLDGADRELLRRELFYTPTDSGITDPDEVGLHPILTGDAELRLIESRTSGTSPEADQVVRRVEKLAHEHKRRVFVRPGDFIATRNNLALHGREVDEVNDEQDLQTRWVLKSLNLDATDLQRHRLVPYTDYLLAVRDNDAAQPR